MLKVRRGEFSGKGIKSINQDCHNVAVPDFSRLGTRGIVAAVADGISSSQVSQYASELAVNHFVRDYLKTCDVWSPARAAELVLRTVNTELYVKTQESPHYENPDKGYVCTFSALILHQQQAVLLHCGDSRIYRIRHGEVTLCTRDHRQSGEGGRSYLSNALGIRPNLDVDISTLDLKAGDTFVLMTDGIAETLAPKAWQALLNDYHADLDDCAEHIARAALDGGCDDNLTVVLLEVTSTVGASTTNYTEAGFLPFIALPKPGDDVDEWQIQRPLYSSERSLVFMAVHRESQHTGVLKMPATSMQANTGFLDEMVKEEWIGNRVTHTNVLNSYQHTFTRSGFYTVMAHFPGSSLRQWYDDNGPATLAQVRDWTTQVINGLTAMHRQGILHQDIRPENIIVNDSGVLTIIDLGAASIAGHNFLQSDAELFIPGDLLFSAPEYFAGLWPDERADQFSLAVLVYHLLSGEYPYNTNVARQSNYAGLLKLRYTSLLQRNVNVPLWVDAALKRACHPQAAKRYPSLSEFLYDLHHPNPAYRGGVPLIERNPVRVWQGISAVLMVLLMVVVVLHYG
ncbi:bifunctional protein-serine/threonine kinase/phosphatase [Alteromonas gilva]|uniref:Bifunctional protein-serine/threonine kinase/phosphatase n=1 Tax=Alteromonas gilva TaxID=2987522 RepID=A0ABT5L362_9ALTE|nr:bifunctional protein-serine/threonine kinase/phosphatase [Alteromonas gilva]MDC8831475.1 bifunctional protein-serine/threonine kinase/phosphatase [Alteromonas gilva]